MPPAPPVLAVESSATGTYNMTDDEPAPISEWLSVYARALGAPAPARIPAPNGEFGRFGMLEARGASNAKARAELGWTPGYSSWRQGFAADLA